MLFNGKFCTTIITFVFLFSSSLPAMQLAKIAKIRKEKKHSYAKRKSDNGKLSGKTKAVLATITTAAFLYENAQKEKHSYKNIITIGDNTFVLPDQQLMNPAQVAVEYAIEAIECAWNIATYNAAQQAAVTMQVQEIPEAVKQKLAAHVTDTLIERGTLYSVNQFEHGHNLDLKSDSATHVPMYTTSGGYKSASTHNVDVSVKADASILGIIPRFFQKVFGWGEPDPEPIKETEYPTHVKDPWTGQMKPICEDNRTLDQKIIDKEKALEDQLGNLRCYTSDPKFISNFSESYRNDCIKKSKQIVNSLHSQVLDLKKQASQEKELARQAEDKAFQQRTDKAYNDVMRSSQALAKDINTPLVIQSTQKYTKTSTVKHTVIVEEDSIKRMSNDIQDAAHAMRDTAEAVSTITDILTWLFEDEDKKKTPEYKQQQLANRAKLLLDTLKSDLEETCSYNNYFIRRFFLVMIQDKVNPKYLKRSFVKTILQEPKPVIHECGSTTPIVPLFLPGTPATPIPWDKPTGGHILTKKERDLLTKNPGYTPLPQKDKKDQSGGCKGITIIEPRIKDFILTMDTEEAQKKWAESEDFKKLNKRLEELEKTVSNVRPGNWNDSSTAGEREYRWAQKKWNEIRSMQDDVKRIANNTGIPEQIIQEIKEHIFYRIHIKKYDIAPFDEDYDMAKAWARLIEGDYVQADLELLRHEFAESMLIDKQQTDYDTAHNIVEEFFSWKKYL